MAEILRIAETADAPVAPTLPTAAQWGLLAAIAAAGITASLVPGWQAYRMSLADGLSPRD